MFFTTLKNIITENKRFYFAYLLLFVGCLILQFTVSQFAITLFINSFHNSFLDIFFTWMTDFGDGIFSSAIVLMLVLFKRKYWLSSILCIFIPALITQLLKHYFFSDFERPSLVMKNFPQLHYIDGLYINELNSFPSGHATQAFALFTFIALIAPYRKYQLLILIFAVLVAISRIYLLQHFFQDVLAGSFIGLSVSTLIFAAFETYNKNRKAIGEVNY
jgi:membrane-associated phospholipid phosphatase